ALRAAIRQVSKLYTGHKITATEAKAGLVALGLPAENVTSLMDLLTIERNNQVLTPTASQLTTAAYYQIIDNATALEGLHQLGYSEWGAWLVLSTRLHAKA